MKLYDEARETGVFNFSISLKYMAMLYKSVNQFKLNLAFILSLFSSADILFKSLILIVVIYVSFFPVSAQNSSLSKNNFRFTITYNQDGSATIVGETRWKKEFDQDTKPCQYFNEQKTDLYRVLIKRIEEKVGHCTGYSLIFIPNVADGELSLPNYLGSIKVEQLVEDTLIKLKSSVRNITPIKNQISSIILTYNLPQIITVNPAPDKKKETKRFTSVTWNSKSASLYADLQVAGTLKRKLLLCEAIPNQEFLSINPHESWDSIIHAVDEYRNDVQADLQALADQNGHPPRGKLSALIFALQIRELAHTAYQNRAENGGWAGNFVRTTLSVSVDDIKRRRQFWTNNQGNCVTAYKKESRLVCDLARKLSGSSGIAYCNAKMFGDEHFKSHLKPGFYSAIKQALINSLFDLTEKGNRQTALIEAYNKIALEHEALISKAIKPGFADIKRQLQADFESQNRQYPSNWAERKIIPQFAKFLVPEQIRPVRIEVLLSVLEDMTRERLITDIEKRLFVEKVLKSR